MSTPSEPAEEIHQLPRPISRQGRKNLFDPDAFANIADTAASTRMIEGVLQALQELGERREILRSGKGGWLIETPSVFAVPNQWVDGHLDVRVDQQHGEVRRLAYDTVVKFRIDSKEWRVFQLAWDAGVQGCNNRDWTGLEAELDIEGISKFHCRNVNAKLALLGLRLEPRRAPRLIKINQTSR